MVGWPNSSSSIRRSSGRCPPISLTSRAGLPRSSCGVSPRPATMVCAIRSACWVASPPCLIGNVGHVPGGVDTGHALDPSERIGRHEARPVSRYACDSCSAEPWHGDDSVGFDRGAGLHRERTAAADAVWGRRSEEPHATVGQLRCYQPRGFGAEHRQRPALRGHQCDLHFCRAHGHVLRTAVPARRAAAAMKLLPGQRTRANRLCPSSSSRRTPRRRGRSRWSRNVSAPWIAKWRARLWPAPACPMSAGHRMPAAPVCTSSPHSQPASGGISPRGQPRSRSGQMRGGPCRRTPRASRPDGKPTQDPARRARPARRRLRWPATRARLPVPRTRHQRPRRAARLQTNQKRAQRSDNAPHQRVTQARLPAVITGRTTDPCTVVPTAPVVIQGCEIASRLGKEPVTELIRTVWIATSRPVEASPRGPGSRGATPAPGRTREIAEIEERGAMQAAIRELQPDRS